MRWCKQGPNRSPVGGGNTEQSIAKRAPTANMLKPNPTMIFSGLTKGSETPTNPSQLLQTQQEPHKYKGEGADPALQQSPGSVPIP